MTVVLQGNHQRGHKQPRVRLQEALMGRKRLKELDQRGGGVVVDGNYISLQFAGVDSTAEIKVIIYYVKVRRRGCFFYC